MLARLVPVGPDLLNWTDEVSFIVVVRFRYLQERCHASAEATYFSHWLPPFE
jgi:hypothetical protein